MLKGVLKDRGFNSSDEIEETITKIWDDLIFDEIQSVIGNWMSPPAQVFENEESLFLKKYGIVSSHGLNLKIGGGRKLSSPPVYINSEDRRPRGLPIKAFINRSAMVCPSESERKSGLGRLRTPLIVCFAFVSPNSIGGHFGRSSF
jgi:hypothetical protein